MYNELNRHKNLDKFKWVLTLIAFLLVGVTITGMLLGYITPITKEEETPVNHEEEIPDVGGLQVGESTNNGVSLMSAELNKEEFATYGVRESAESAFVLNAIISPSTVANQGVEWEAFWSGVNSDFSLNESVSDYVKISPQVDTTSLLVECLAPFGDTIVVQAISKDNPSLTAFCELDYAQKVLGVSVSIGNVSVALDGETKVQYELCPYATGMGGVITVDIETNDVYTIAQDFEKTITFSQDANRNNWFNINGVYPEGIQLLYREGVTNWIGEAYYFDFENDIREWLSGALLFSDLSTSQLVDYFENITSNTLAVMSLTIEGEYDSYTYTSSIICTGYTNSTTINDLHLDVPNYVF